MISSLYNRNLYDIENSVVTRATVNLIDGGFLIYQKLTFQCLYLTVWHRTIHLVQYNTVTEVTAWL